MYTYKTWQDKDNEIFSEPLHADASQCSQLNRQMMGGSQQTRPTKYNLLSRSVIHLLHSDQFVLINPHKGGLCETKAPGDNERAPPTTTTTPETHPPPPSTSLHLKCSPSQHIVARACHRGSSLAGTEPNKRGTPERGGKEENSPFPHPEWNISGRGGGVGDAQCDVSYCIQVTPSINSEINLDVAYKEPRQRKGKRGYSNFQRREKVGFSLLLVLVTPVAAVIGKCRVLLCNNPVQSVRWHLSGYVHVKPCLCRTSVPIEQSRRNIVQREKVEYFNSFIWTRVTWIHSTMCSTCN